MDTENPKPQEVQKAVREVMEGVDKNKDKVIEADERRLDADIFAKTQKLKKFMEGDDLQKAALQLAIEEVIRDYKGLTSKEIYRWILGKRVLERPKALPKTDKKTGLLARPSERSDIDEAWEGMTIEDRKAALLEGQKNIELTQEQKQRFEQFQLLTLAVQGLQEYFQKEGKHILEKASLLYRGVGAADFERARGIIDNVLNRDIPEISRLILTEKDTSFSKLMNRVFLDRLGERLHGFEFVLEGLNLNQFGESMTKVQFSEQQLGVVKWLRGRGGYQSARFLMEDALKGEFDNVFQRDFKLRDQEVQVGGQKMTMKVDKDTYLHSTLKIKGKFGVKGRDKIALEAMQKDPALTIEMAKQRASELINALVYQDYLYGRSERIADRIHGKKDLSQVISADKKVFWDQYKDLMGIGALDLADESWDMILDELVVNAPLIIVSGGVAAVARKAASAGLSWSARAVLGAARAERLVQRAGLAGRFAGGAAGLAFEGAVFEMTNMGLRGEWLFNSPDWATQIVWTSLALGAFKGGGKLSEAWFGKENLLKEAMKKVTIPGVAQGVGQFIAKGHMEVAAMLIIGAAQHGAYGGDMNEFFDNFGKELFHAYVSVGSLKIAGKLVHRENKVETVEPLNSRFQSDPPEVKVQKVKSYPLPPLHVPPPRPYVYTSRSARDLVERKGSDVVDPADRPAEMSQSRLPPRSSRPRRVAPIRPGTISVQSSSSAEPTVRSTPPRRVAPAPRPSSPVRAPNPYRPDTTIDSVSHKEAYRLDSPSSPDAARAESASRVHEVSRELDAQGRRSMLHNARSGEMFIMENGDTWSVKSVVRGSERGTHIRFIFTAPKTRPREVDFYVNEITPDFLSRIRRVQESPFSDPRSAVNVNVDGTDSIPFARDADVISIDSQPLVTPSRRALPVRAANPYRPNRTIDPVSHREPYRVGPLSSPDAPLGRSSEAPLPVKHTPAAQPSVERPVIAPVPETIRKDLEMLRQNLAQIDAGIADIAHRPDTPRKASYLQEQKKLRLDLEARIRGREEDLRRAEAQSEKPPSSSSERAELQQQFARAKEEHQRLRREFLEAEHQFNEEQRELQSYELEAARPDASLQQKQFVQVLRERLRGLAKEVEKKHQSTLHYMEQELRPVEIALKKLLAQDQVFQASDKALKPVERRLSPEQIAWADALENGHLKGVPVNNIRYALEKGPTRMTGLPEFSGQSAEVYFLPVLAHGAMGMVREIFYRTPEGRVVRKIIKSSFDPQAINSFGIHSEKFEAILKEEHVRLQALQEIGPNDNLMQASPEILRDQYGRQHILMEHAGNTNIKALSQKSDFTPSMAKLVFVQAMRGLNAMHKHGLVHLDFKPDNLGVDTVKLKAGAPDAVKLIDFGITTVRANLDVLSEPLQRVRDIDASKVGDIRGTPFYMGMENGYIPHYAAARDLFDKNCERHFLPTHDYLAFFYSILKVGTVMVERGADLRTDMLFKVAYEMAHDAVKAEKIEDIDRFYGRINRMLDPSSSEPVRASPVRIEARP